VHPICDLQIEYSLISRGIEKSILPTLRELGIGLTAYGVLSRGLISGHWSKARAGEQDFRGTSPRFQGENLEKTLALVEILHELARAKGTTVAQLAIAWVLAQGEDIVALAGARTRERLTEVLGAPTSNWAPRIWLEIARAVPADAAAGERYDTHQMRILDSERSAWGPPTTRVGVIAMTLSSLREGWPFAEAAISLRGVNASFQ
jgi:aryl-alcohol dehydrogenase-like predicted oxidoreductase